MLLTVYMKVFPVVPIIYCCPLFFKSRIQSRTHTSLSIFMSPNLFNLEPLPSLIFFVLNVDIWEVFRQNVPPFEFAWSFLPAGSHLNTLLHRCHWVPFSVSHPKTQQIQFDLLVHLVSVTVCFSLGPPAQLSLCPSQNLL